MHHSKQLALPDLIAMCPWSSSVNPHLDTVGPESAAWVDSFNIFRGKKRTAFQSAAAELCAARTYPYASRDDYRTACDFVNLLFVADEVSDDQDVESASETGNTFVRAMQGELEDDKSTIVRLTHEWRTRFVRKDLPNSQRRFIQQFADYLNGVSREVKLRDEKYTLDLNQYILLRRSYSGTQTVFGLFEFIHGIDLPDAVFEDPIFTAMYRAAVDMVNFANDVYSYGMEYSKGLDVNNLVTVLMQAEGLGLQDAVNKVGRIFKELVGTFIGNKAKLPSFSFATGGYVGIDEDVAKYVHSMEQWVIGSLHWSFESIRYFGPQKEDVARMLVYRLPEQESEVDETLVCL